MVFSMVEDTTLETTEFSGKIYMTILDGDYINTYKIANGIAISRYEKPEDKLSKDVYARSSDEECWGIACGMEGDEIYLEGKGRGSDNNIPILWLFLPTESSPYTSGGMEPDAGIGWDYGFGGGSSHNDNSNSNYPNVEDELDDIGPSCKSFIFEKVASNWQVSVVEGVRFKLRIYEQIGTRTNIVIANIEYNSAIQFGTPKFDRYG